MALFRRNSRKGRPGLPDGVRIYAIGDVHGRSDLLQQLLTVIDADLENSRPERAIHVFLGDYVDRGPDSRGVLDLLIARSQSHEAVFLKGNHEAFLLDVLKDPAKLPQWRHYGGFVTMMSYGVRPTMNPGPDDQVRLVEEMYRSMPGSHLQFLRGLRPSFTCGDFFFVHAGVRPGVSLADQSEDDLLWIREEFLNSDQDFGKYVVHGHTPVNTPDMQPNRVNIDTGAYATGNLTLLTIQGNRLLAL